MHEESHPNSPSHNSPRRCYSPGRTHAPSLRPDGRRDLWAFTLIPGTCSPPQYPPSLIQDLMLPNADVAAAACLYVDDSGAPTGAACDEVSALISFAAFFVCMVLDQPFRRPPLPPSPHLPGDLAFSIDRRSPCFETPAMNMRWISPEEDAAFYHHSRKRAGSVTQAAQIAHAACCDEAVRCDNTLSTPLLVRLVCG